MIKNVSILSLALVSLINFAAQAQEQAQVGNSGSANMMMVEEGYVVENTTPQEAPSQEGTNSDSATVVDQITGVETPDSLDIEEDETIIPND